MAFGLTPSGVSNMHMPGEEWTLAAGQGCAPGYTEQQLPNGNWTCISAADFAQVQAGNFTPLVAIGAAPTTAVTFTPPGSSPVVWAPPPPLPVAPSAASVLPVADRTPSAPGGSMSLQFAAANADMAASPVASPSGGAASSSAPPTSSPFPLGLIALAALGAFLLTRRGRHE